MRDINRIEPIMQRVTYIWKTYCPDYRFCQFIDYLMREISMALGGMDSFYLEDDRIQGILEEIELKLLWEKDKKLFTKTKKVSSML